MKNKRLFHSVGVLLTTTILFSGCGAKLPALTDAESSMIAEYATGLLLKYDVHHVNRLVEDAEIERAYEKAYHDAMVEELVKQYNEEKKEEKPDREEELLGGNGSQTGGREEVSFEEVLGVADSFKLEYSGYEICNTYPTQNEEELYFSVDALPGNKLVVVKFVLMNQTQEDITLNMMENEIKYLLSINDTEKYLAEATLLPQDMTFFYETVPANENTEIFLVFEVPTEIVEGEVRMVMKAKASNHIFQLELTEQ